MECDCTCSCDDHRTCSCRENWCSCLIEDRIKKRKRCHGNGLLEIDSMMSLSGFFIGQFCPKCGLKGRISEFYREHKNLIPILERHKEN